ncbi:beta-1,3-galactosyltransferase 5-like [Lytechinus pictus]|uniref:beta-1,3-galactosyltransferase 5-like n=1 Tax=Lytechinus pictus TaxID=7653 RepID=UPI00240E554C|nr:beta-1,3-galactosyltransferase 5-like [Lytechinus pictus]
MKMMRCRFLWRVVMMCGAMYVICVYHLTTYPGKLVRVSPKPNPMKVGWLKKVRWTPGTLKVDIYDYSINPVNTCKTNDRRNTTLLILIKSAPSHRSRRQAIRETYISDIKRNNMSVRVLFILGNTKYERERELIKTEADEQKDILQADFNDHYYNLTIKLIMGFKWVTNFCRNSEFVMSIDDDVMLDIFTLFEDLQTFKGKNRTNFCLAKPNTWPPDRKEDSKWYCPKAIYPYEAFPVSPYGHGYVLSQDVVRKLYDASKTLLPVVPFDDVYCGMLMNVKSIGIIDRQKFHKKRHPDSKAGDYLRLELNTFEMKRAWEDFEGFFKKRRPDRYERLRKPSSVTVPLLLLFSVLVIIIILCSVLSNCD